MASADVPAQRWVRIIPVAFVMYTIAFIDRNNIAFGFAGMQRAWREGSSSSATCSCRSRVPGSPSVGAPSASSPWPCWCGG